MKLALVFTGLVLGAVELARRVARLLADRSSDLARAAMGALEP
jgi:hypothetical protein